MLDDVRASRADVLAVIVCVEFILVKCKCFHSIENAHVGIVPLKPLTLSVSMNCVIPMVILVPGHVRI